MSDADGSENDNRNESPELVLHPAGSVHFLPAIVEISIMSILTCQPTSNDLHNLATLLDLQEASTNHLFRANEDLPNEESPNEELPN